VAALALHALERAAPAGQTLSLAAVSFVQPLRVAEARLAVDVYRSGKTATALGVRLEQGGGPAAVATGWASAAADTGARVDVRRPTVGGPEAYEPRTAGDTTVPFVDRELELRPVPTPDEGTAAAQWMRLTRVEIAGGEPWPAAAVAVVADMVGAGQYRAAHLLRDVPQVLLSLDLTLHLVDQARGPWLLAEFDNVALDRGRAVGRGELWSEDGRFVASVTQQSLVRPSR
jgi:acyl-CoA thioesterase